MGRQNPGFTREIQARIPGFVTDDSSCYHCYHCEVWPAGNQGNFPIYGGTKTEGGADSGAVVFQCSADFSALQFSAVQCSTIQCSAVQCNAEQ